MRERLAAFTQGLSARVGPLAARTRSVVGPVWTTLARWSGIAWRTSVRVARATAAFTARMLAATLLAIETTLLSPRGRERVHAMSVFALIFAFAVTSVDMLVTGGPDVISSAQAASAPSSRVDLIASTSLRGSDNAAVELASLDTAELASAPLAEAAPLPLTPVSLPSNAEPVADLLDAPAIKAEHDETAATVTGAGEKFKDGESDA